MRNISFRNLVDHAAQQAGKNFELAVLDTPNAIMAFGCGAIAMTEIIATAANEGGTLSEENFPAPDAEDMLKAFMERNKALLNLEQKSAKDLVAEVRWKIPQVGNIIREIGEEKFLLMYSAITMSAINELMHMPGMIPRGNHPALSRVVLGLTNGLDDTIANSDHPDKDKYDASRATLQEMIDKAKRRSEE